MMMTPTWRSRVSARMRRSTSKPSISRHHDVEQHEIDVLAFELVERLAAVGRLDGALIALALQPTGRRPCRGCPRCHRSRRPGVRGASVMAHPRASSSSVLASRRGSRPAWSRSRRNRRPGPLTVPDHRVGRQPDDGNAARRRSAFSCRVASQPSITGRLMSMSTRPGLSLRTVSMPAAPSLATATS